MQLFVNLPGEGTVAAQATEGTVGAFVESFGLSKDAVHVVANGRGVDMAAMVSTLEENTTLDVNCDLLGGGKKRKKKTYTKPKKIKRKHKKVKLGVLKFYKVADGSKVQRLRKECPNCGPGVFMGMHNNRYCCGRCTLTYLFTNKDDEE